MTASENTVKDDSLKSPGMTPEIPDLREGDYTELGRYFQENAAEKTPAASRKGASYLQLRPGLPSFRGLGQRQMETEPDSGVA